MSLEQHSTNTDCKAQGAKVVFLVIFFLVLGELRSSYQIVNSKI